MPGLYDNIASLLPVDLLVNTIIAMVPAVKRNAQKAKAKGQQPSLMLCHSCTSDVQPSYRWRYPKYGIRDYFAERGYQPSRRVGPPTIRFVTSRLQWEIEFFLRYTIPSTMMSTVAQLTDVESHKKLAFNLSLLRSKLLNLTNAFMHFMMNQWVFDCHNTRWIHGCLPPQEREVFFDSEIGIDWVRYTELFCFGLAHFVLKEESAPKVATKEAYVNKFGNATTYTSSLRERLLYDYTYHVNRLAKNTANGASTVWNWTKEKLKTGEPSIALSKL